MAHHARLSPSNTRWPHCPGSVREEAVYPDISGDAAIDGTGTHLLLEMAFLEDRDPHSYAGEIIGVNHPDKPTGWVVDADRAERAKTALSYLARRRKELFDQFPGCVVHIVSESKADPGALFGRDDWYGTCDLCIRVFVDGDHLTGRCVFVEVIDYKDGRGFVSAIDNTQLIGYLGGKIRPIIGSGPQLVRPFEARTLQLCRMTIVQPKTNPVIRYDEVTGHRAIELIETLSKKAHLTDRPDAPLVPGKHCTWCKHKPNCTADAEQSVEELKTMTTEIVTSDGLSLFQVIEQTFGDVTQLSDDRLATLLDTEDALGAVYDRAREEATRRLDTGGTVPGYALVPGKGSNVWNDTEENIAKILKARKLTKDEIYPPKLISPAQIMKHPKLTAEQKERLKKDHIAYKAGDAKLGKVARQTPEEKAAAAFFDFAAPTTFSFL